MKILKSIGTILVVILLLFAVVVMGNHSVAFWKLISDSESEYSYFYEDFSNISFTESEYLDSGKTEYRSESDVRIIPWGGTFTTDGGYLTLNLDENQIDKYPCVKIPYDRLNAKENFALDRLSYFVVTYELWTESNAPRMLYMRNFVYNNEELQSITTLDHCNLAYVGGVYKNSRDDYTKFTFADKYLSVSNSRSNRDKICCVVTVNNEDVSKSTVTYYLNGVENELSYSNWINSDSTYISHFELSVAKPNKACSISFDNFAVYAFGKEFDGDITDVLKEVKYK